MIRFKREDIMVKKSLVSHIDQDTNQATDHTYGVCEESSVIKKEVSSQKINGITLLLIFR